MVIRLLELISVEKAYSLRVKALGVPTSSPETMQEQHKPRWEWLIKAWLLLITPVLTFLNSAQVFFWFCITLSAVERKHATNRIY